MKKILVLAFALFSSNSFAEELKNFEQLRDVILTKNIRLKVDFVGCPLYPGIRRGVAIFSPDKFETEWAGEEETIITSFKHLTTRNPLHPDLPVYELITFKFNGQYYKYGIQKVDVIKQVFNANDFSPLGEKIAIKCEFGLGGVKAFTSPVA